jgi:hypothetical protein
VEASETVQPGYAMGAALVAFIVTPQVLAIAGVVDLQRCGAGDIMMGLYLIGIGTMFLASYYWSHKTFVFRGLIWICEHFSHPPGRKMAFFYFALCLLLGVLGLLAGFGLIEHRYAC